MSVKLDEGERRRCDSWLRSELMPYSKGELYVHCTCIALWSQVGFISTALHSGWSCCICTCWPDFCI